MRFPLYFAIAAIVVACSSSSSSGTSATSCVAGQQISCACAGGTQGAQACKTDGSGYLACDCGGDSGVFNVNDSGISQDSGGSDDASMQDSGPDTSLSFDAAGCSYNQNPLDTTDNDHDGFSVAEGDCDDCDDNIYPGHGCP